jgi:hypothetical protein
MKNKPNLLKNEKVLLSSVGGYKSNLRSGWKPGDLYLTDMKIFLWQSAKILFQVALKDIKEISVHKKFVIIKNRDVLRLSYLNNTEITQVWIMTKEVEIWKNKIFERSLLEIDQEKIEKICEILDTDSQDILLFIWQNRHVTIDELANIYDAPSHMDILHKIKDVINPASQKIIGFPVLTFRNNCIDELTGKKIQFSWWIIGGDKLKENKNQLSSLLDIFDEENSITIIMELKGVQDENIMLEVNEYICTVSCQTPDGEYLEEIPLSSKVKPEGMSQNYNNNILEIRLCKQ